MMKLIYKMIYLSFLLSAAAVLAQDNVISLGGSFTHNGNLPTTVKGALGVLKDKTNLPGADLGFSAKVAGPLGLALDLNFSHAPGNTQITFAGGPELTFRGKANQLFLHALVGGAHQEQATKFPITNLADSSFAYFLGGGVRHFFGKHFGLQAGADYFYTEAFKASEHNLRLNAGIAIRL
jgi:hypothetical protein